MRLIAKLLWTVFIGALLFCAATFATGIYGSGGTALGFPVRFATAGDICSDTVTFAKIPCPVNYDYPALGIDILAALALPALIFLSLPNSRPLKKDEKKR